MTGDYKAGFTFLNLRILIPLFFLILSNYSSNAGEKFKIITYNVWDGYRDGKHPRFPCFESGQKRKEGIYKWLKTQNADVVVFQELIGYSADKLKEESGFWGHHYAVILKDKGMSIGISSRYPVKVYERFTEGMHHGLIYCSIDGIDIIATHLWPRFDEKILDEVSLVKNRVSESYQQGRQVILLGDFNAFSPEDDLFIDQETIRNYQYWNWKLNNGRPDYRVIKALLDMGLKDLHVMFRPKGIKREERYDFIFASQFLADKCIKATHFNGKKFLKLSDHFPVEAVFKKN